MSEERESVGARPIVVDRCAELLLYSTAADFRGYIQRKLDQVAECGVWPGVMSPHS